MSTMKFRLIALVGAGFMLASVASAQGVSQKAPGPKPKRKHALTYIARAAAATVTHPKRTFGYVVAAVEAGNDVALLGLTALDKAASVELKHNPFHYAAVVDAKVDSGLEYVEEYFLGVPNS